MLIKVFSLKFDGMMGCFDDKPIRDFTQDKEVLQVRDHLLIRNEIPYLVLVIKYYPFRKEIEEEQMFNSKQTANAWKKEIAESDFPIFNRLRDWRSERCKKEGIPPYLIFTNQQLALIIKKKPQSLSELVQIEGIGRGKSDRYGVDVLAITRVPTNG